MTAPMPSPRALDWLDLPESARRVYRELLRYGPLSRAELAERLGLSAASLTRVSAPLVERKLVVEGTPETREVGRPSIPLDVALGGFSLVGVSITHEWVTVIATDARLEVRASSARALTRLDPRVVLGEVAEMVGDVLGELAAADGAGPVAALGVSIGGQVDGGRVVRHAPFLGWEMVPAADILEEATGLPVLIDHDLTALAEAESWFGVGRDVDRFIVLTVGVGTGFALGIDGRIVTDANTGFGTITDAILGAGWPDFAHADALSERERDDAARAVGRLAATAAAFTMPQAVVISGEGAATLSGHEEALDAGISEVRHHRASGLDVQLREHDFAFWARGAATAAIQWVLGQS